MSEPHYDSVDVANLEYIESLLERIVELLEATVIEPTE